MPRVTNATLFAQADLDAGTTAAVATVQAAYPDASIIRAYQDTSGAYVVTVGLTSVDGVQSPLNVVVSGGAIVYHEPRTDAEPYSEVVSRIEELLLPARRRPPTGALSATGKVPTLA